MFNLLHTKVDILDVLHYMIVIRGLFEASFYDEKKKTRIENRKDLVVIVAILFIKNDVTKKYLILHKSIRGKKAIE